MSQKKKKNSLPTGSRKTSVPIPQEQVGPAFSAVGGGHPAHARLAVAVQETMGSPVSSTGIW